VQKIGRGLIFGTPTKHKPPLQVGIKPGNLPKSIVYLNDLYHLEALTLTPNSVKVSGVLEMPILQAHSSVSCLSTQAHVRSMVYKIRSTAAEP
jgi:hypothetical protein